MSFGDLLLPAPCYLKGPGRNRDCHASATSKAAMSSSRGASSGGIAGGRGAQSHGRAENSPVARSSALVGSLPAPCDERACGVFLGAEGAVGALEFSIRDDTASWLRYKSDWGLPLLSLRTPGKRVPVRGRIACSSALKAGSGLAANSPRNCLHTTCQSDSVSHPTCSRP